VQPAEDAAKAAVADALGDQGNAALPTQAKTCTQKRPDVAVECLLDERHGPVEVVGVGQGQGLVAQSGRSLEQGPGTGNAFEQGIPAVGVQENTVGHRS